MISDDLLAELKQILLEDYKTQLPEKDLKLFAENLKGIFSQLVGAVSKKQAKVELIIKNHTGKELLDHKN